MFKRITMGQNINKINQYRLLFMCGCMLFCFTVLPAQTPLEKADKMPYFSGCKNLEDHSIDKKACSDQALITFIIENIQYPEEAKKQQIEGTMLISFVVDEKGRTGQTEILKDIGGKCGDEAFRLIDEMPKWEPALHNGKKVKVKLKLPIHFSFKEDTTQNQQYNIYWGQVSGKQIQKEELVALLQNKIIVRDALGNLSPISELSFSYKKRRKIKSAASSGRITDKMKGLVQKMKKGSHFMIVATVQKDQTFIDVTREFLIKK